MLAEFLTLPDAAHAPPPAGGLDQIGRVHAVMKVERQNLRMGWCEQPADGQPQLLVHLPLQGSVHLRLGSTADAASVAAETICRPGQMLLNRRPRLGRHQNRLERGVFRNCWTLLSGSALLAAADAVIAANGPLIELAQHPLAWRQLHEWFSSVLQHPLQDAAGLTSGAFSWLARLVQSPRPSGIAAALAVIERRLDDPELGIPDLALAAECAVSTFSRRFRGVTGRSPYGYVLSRRIDRARDALLGRDPVALIARRCGFRDSAHFVHRFREAVGESPDRYRRRLLP